MSNKTFILVAGFLVVLLVGAGAVYLYDASQSDDIAKGVQVGGVDVGGLNEAQAADKLQRELRRAAQPARSRSPGRGGHDFTLTAKRAQVTMDVDGMVQEAHRQVARRLDRHARLARVTGGTVNANLAAEGRLLRLRGQPRSSAASAHGRRASRRTRCVSLRARRGLEGPPPTTASPCARRRSCARDIEQTLTAPDGRARRAGRGHEGASRRSRPTSLRQEVPELHHRQPQRLPAPLYHNLKLAKTYAIAVGMQGLETPAGLYHVQNKAGQPGLAGAELRPGPGPLAGQVIPPRPAGTRSRRAGWASTAAPASTASTERVRLDRHRRLARLRPHDDPRRDRALRPQSASARPSTSP